MSNKSRYETAIKDMNKFDKGTAHIANEWIDPYRQELEQQKAELIEELKDLAQSETCSYRELDILIKKYSEE